MVATGMGSVFRLSLAAALVALLACSDAGSGGKSSLAELGVDDGASNGQTATLLITSDAPAVLKLDTGARLSIPAGSVDDDTEVVMKRPADRQALPLLKMVQSTYRVASAPYVVTPHGKSFNKELELSLPIAKGNPDRLVVAYLEDEEDTSWEVHAKPKVEANGAKVMIRHFSVYVLLEQLDDVAIDAGAGSDAGVSRDAGASTGTVPERAKARFAECGLIAQEGSFDPDYVPANEQERCTVECLLDSACPDLATQFCADAAPPSDALMTCLTACGSYSIVECQTAVGTLIVPSCDGEAQCLNGADEANCPPEAFIAGCQSFSMDGKPVSITFQCDGDEDCIDGVDEQGCPAGTHFVCESGERVSAHGRCDGYSNCGDASDEAGCVEFTCADGAQVVPEAVLCDLTRDCSDGSDEDQGCLKLTCEPPLDGDKMLRRAARTWASYKR